ncbi:glycoside hydrolase family 18 [Terrimonas sp. NA20]|uniref:mannosyl-glycoprotein endo-beta-N-acetylglucosaminidase n=1 Tax=Terrimonas ginsenosidimutans TaxID=2908004 RepID=A0ABS9KSP5_9BACT|nr:glycoside hydrolase family 18 [Terrimonas ginsenosidimutans]MCG2615325.1 glycoside hydrolase family 18 [Terrimonas ginsenosidimutans]
MKTKLLIAFVIIVSASFVACKKENIEIQKPFEYSDEYYANLRAYKKSDHQICFGWFADYSQTFSYGMHFKGLPDSIDILSLWGGIPKKEDNPSVWEELRFVRDVKGMRLVAPVIVQLEGNNMPINDEGLQMYADYLVKIVTDNDLDGLDMDWEPVSGTYLNNAENFAKLVVMVSQKLGPKSGTGKLLIVDYYNHTLPTTIEPYLDYLVNQAYTQGTTSNSGANLQTRYNRVAAWCPPNKFIVTENIGDWWQNGGSPFTEVNGNTISPVDGLRMYSLEGMARWNPTQGTKAGFGAFYFGRDYNSNPPYKYMRRAIQVANPAVK